MQFSKRMDRFGDEVFSSLNQRRVELEHQGRSFFDLSIGTPDFETDIAIRQAMAEAAMKPENWKYALRDSDTLLDEVIAYYRARFGVSITRDMICSCYGSQEGIGHIGLVLCDEGDTVLLPSPCYPVFIAGARMAGADPYYYPMAEDNGFLPKLEDIPEDVAERAKYMIVSLPSNPMGSIGTPELYQSLIAFAKRHKIILIHDNAYSDIIYDGIEGGSFLQYEGAAEVGAEFFSLSKSFNLTGARVSFLIGNPELIAAFRKLRSQIDFGMFLPIQQAAIAAMRTERTKVRAQCDEYQARRDALCEGMSAIGWPIPKNKGSMFVWAKLPAAYTSSMDFCLELMDRAGVICTPGASFGPLGEGYVRFALVLPPDRIREACLAVQESGILMG
ncbi:MAG: aminotransferase class I/II-fold pyridoxal phosphate-dependent enzyme [Clostridia bacterium]|nr:aminotransferase class I/II-fold pyridoxal phosphate-dependent enzyme [Clostridia bacterium]